MIQSSIGSAPAPDLKNCQSELDSLGISENQIAVEGFVWNQNSFDQWGVELGKVLANQVRTQLSKSRKNSENVTGFNPSTTALLKRYLQ